MSGQFPNQVIRASAGTGKTFALSNRYLALLAADATPDSILATTFTRKAAGEILDRVLMRLSAAAQHEAACLDLSKHLKIDLTVLECRRLLLQLTRNLHRLRVCTLDAFFVQIAQSFSLELGLPPGWQIAEDIEDGRLREQAIDAVLENDSEQEIARIIHLLTQGDADRTVNQLLRATVNELYEAYLETEPSAWHQFPDLKRLPDETLDAAIEALRTVHVDDKRMEKARVEDVATAARRDWETFISRGLGAKIAAGADSYYKKPIPPDMVALYDRLIAHAKAVLVDMVAKQTSGTFELLRRFDYYYQRRKNETRVLRFDDLTRRLSSQRQWDGGLLEYRLDGRISHLLFDEFQDTSLPQWLVVRPLAERVTSNTGQQTFVFEGSQTSFFCVGDVKQAIYGWRGGRSEIFDALETQLERLDFSSLTKSYRSAPPIIETVNSIFQNLLRHPDLEHREDAVRHWAQQFQEHSTDRTDFAGFASLRIAPRADDGEGQSEITMDFAAERVAQIAKENPGRSIGVLTRTNGSIAQMIFGLRKRSVEASEEGGNPITDSAAVQLTLSLIRMSDHPGDLAARFHVSESPLGERLGFTHFDDDVAANQLSWEVRQSLLTLGYGQSIQRWSELVEQWCSDRDRKRLNQLVVLAYEYQRFSSLRPAEFCDFVAGKRIPDPSSADIRVMTIHQSKGLQFDIVVLPDLEILLSGRPDALVTGQSDPSQPVDRVSVYRSQEIQEILPPEFQKMFAEDARQKVMESLCLLYVAVTRPVHMLEMILDPPSPKERKIPRKISGILRASLAPDGVCEPDTIIFQQGDPNWSLVTKSPDPSKPPASPIQRIKLAPTSGTTKLRRQAPSGLEGGRIVSIGDILQLENRGALARGTLIHSFFEEIDWLDEGTPSMDRLRQIAEPYQREGLNIDDVLQQFRRMLRAPEIDGALRRDAYRSLSWLEQAGGGYQVHSYRLEVRNEFRFAVRDGERLLSGSIDRLVLIIQDDSVVGAEVIDFKTDTVLIDDDSRIEETVEHYRPQQEAYRTAVSRLFGLPASKVRLRLLLVSPGLVKEL
jgi:ATP-dependent helicase/nuclease subunit A